MASDDRLNSDLRRALKTIAIQNVPFNPAEAAENADVMERTMKGVVQAMKEVDPLFQELSQRYVFSSSYYEKVCIKRVAEFDLNVLVRLPFQSEDVETCVPEGAPEFVTYQLKRDPTSILDHDRKWTPELYQKLPDFFDQDLFLVRSKVQEWLKGVVDKAWNGRKFPQMLKKQSESGSNFAISFKKRKIVVDVVPVIEGHQNVPPRGIYKSDRFIQLKQSNQSKGKNRQNIQRKTPHANASRGHPHVVYEPAGPGYRNPSKIFQAEALDYQDLPHRRPRKLNDFVPNGFGDSGDTNALGEYEEADDDARGYRALRSYDEAHHRSNDRGGTQFRGGFGYGRGDGGRGEPSGGWHVVKPRRPHLRGGGDVGGGNDGSSTARAPGDGASHSWRQYPPSLPVHSWYLVPKLRKQQNAMATREAQDSFWQISFPEAEKRLLQKTGCLVMLIRLFKFLRDQRNWIVLSSNAIKTLFIEEFDRLQVDSDYWMETKLGTLFLDLLEVLTGAIRNRHVPHYFNREANLLENLSEQTAENIVIQLEAMNSEIRDNPKLVYKHFAC